jgi:hypothetical protein
MDTNGILQELRAERDRLDRAITAIQGITSDGARRSPAKRTRRQLSPAARKRISLARKKWWAEQKHKKRARRTGPKKSVAKATATKKPAAAVGVSATARKTEDQNKAKPATG